MSLLKSQKRREHASETSKWQHKMKSSLQELWDDASNAHWTMRCGLIFPIDATGKILGGKKGMLKKEHIEINIETQTYSCLAAVSPRDDGTLCSRDLHSPNIFVF